LLKPFAASADTRTEVRVAAARLVDADQYLASLDAPDYGGQPTPANADEGW